MPLALDGEVELALLVVATADHGENPAVPGVDRHERRGRIVPLGQPFVDRLRGEMLQVEVDGRVDLEPAAEDLPGAVVGDELLLDVLGEVALAAGRHGQVYVPRLRQLLRVCGQLFLERDQALVVHHLENEAPTRLGGLRVRGRVVRAGARRQAREEGGLRERQVARVLAEVDARGHLDPVGAVPEVDGVQVGGEDPVLRPLALELPCEGRLLQLAADRALLLRVRVLDELLRDRRAALDDRLVPDVGPDGAQDAAVVDPWCSQKRRSSTATIACFMIGEMSSLPTTIRLSSPRRVASTVLPSDA